MVADKIDILLSMEPLIKDLCRVIDEIHRKTEIKKEMDERMQNLMRFIGITFYTTDDSKKLRASYQTELSKLKDLVPHAGPLK